MTKIIAAFCFAMTATLACAVHAKTATADVTDMNALREAVKTDKRAFVASTLALTDAQAKRFWPIYDQYQRGMEAANRIRAVALQGLLSREGPVTDLYAKQLAGDLIASDEAEVKARRTMYGKVMRAIPATKAARYMQLESKVRAVQNYDLAAAFPLIK